jgi:hypothetical protein
MIVVPKKSRAQEWSCEAWLPGSTVDSGKLHKEHELADSWISAKRALPLSGYNRLCLALDRPHIREYVRHPRAVFEDSQEGSSTQKPQGET